VKQCLPLFLKVYSASCIDARLSLPCSGYGFWQRVARRRSPSLFFVLQDGSHFSYCREAAMPASSPEGSWYPEARKCAARVPSNDLYVLQSSRNGNAHISKLFFAVSFDKVRT
jgi:hypothetical protein